MAVVSSLSEQQWQFVTAITGVFGLSIAFSLGWLYFDNLSSRAIEAAHTRNRIIPYQVWLYTHLPLVISLTSVGVGVKHIISSQPEVALSNAERWFICGAIALCFLTLGLLLRTDTISSPRRRAKQRFVGALIAIAVAIVGQNFLPIAVIGLMALLCIGQVVLELSQVEYSAT